jgi:threonine dehydrogenase-like Zn-dependent dehydrogenase
MSAAFAAREMGAAKVMICDLSEKRLANARKMGFEICNNGTEDVREKGKQVFGPNTMARKDAFNADSWIDAAGAAAVPAIYQDVAKFASTLVVVGVHNDPRPIDLKRVTYSQSRIQGSAGYEAVDFPILFQIFEKYPEDVVGLISHVFPQDDLEKAIVQATNSAESLKVIIQF